MTFFHPGAVLWTYLSAVGRAGSSLLCVCFLCSRVVLCGCAQASHRSGVPRCGAQALVLRCMGSLPCGMRGLPRPGVTPRCPALADRVSSPAPPGKSRPVSFNSWIDFGDQHHNQDTRYFHPPLNLPGVARFYSQLPLLNPGAR